MLATALSLLVCALTAASAAVVNTKYGALRGISTTMDNGVVVDTFYNIPFAQPPLGNLRFRKPLTISPWSGVRDATTKGPQCPQPPYPPNENVTMEGQEDCLYLNVHVPRTHDQSGHGSPLPVMFWIHGGAYYLGTANVFDGRALAAMGVVVVTTNYRLGALGFLCTEDGNSPGNYGLYDQIMALKWVRDVIASFNGNPNEVTIFGQSAGSGSVSLLAESREAAGLFNKAIMESGVSLSPWAVGMPSTKPRPLGGSVRLATRLGCPTAEYSSMVNCLRTKEPKSLVEITSEFTIEDNNLITFRPVVETTFGQVGILSAAPEVVLRNGWFNNVTVIRGYTKDEYGLFPGLTDDPVSVELFRNLTRQFVEQLVIPHYPGLGADRLVEMVINTYIRPGTVDPEELRRVLIQLATDFLFAAPSFKEMNLYSKANGKTEYLYRFSFRSANRQIPLWQGVLHGGELVYVFGAPLVPNGTFSFEIFNSFVSAWTDDDRAVARQVMTWWTNFAKYGNPTPDGSSGPTWLPWTTATPRFLEITSQSAMVDRPETPGEKLWNDVIPQMAAGGHVVG